MSHISVHTLRCGMPVAFETNHSVRSAGLAWLLPAGSAHDPADRQGIAPLTEELLLRGSDALDSRAQADAFDALGVVRGTITRALSMAYTSTMLGARIPDALPLIVDSVRTPRFDPESLEASRDLCIQAIESLADHPQERVALVARERHAPEPFNRSGMGLADHLEKITPEDLAKHWPAHAVPGGAVLALSGAIDPKAIIAQLDGLFDGWTGAAPDPRPTSEPPRGYLHIEQATSQAHICIVFDAPPEPDPSSPYERLVVNTLSGGMSGRLFTEVREKRSLCYAVHASYRAEKDYGRTSAYVGTSPERAQEALDVLWNEMTRINAPVAKGGGFDADEYERASIGLKSSLVMSGESTRARADALAADMRRLGRPRSLDERIAEVDRVGLAELNAYLEERSPGRATIVSIGPEPLKPPF